MWVRSGDLTCMGSTEGPCEGFSSVTASFHAWGSSTVTVSPTVTFPG